MEEKIFKTYDIRGKTPHELDQEDAYKIGRSFATFLEEDNPEIVVGRDGRETSPDLFQQFKKGLVDSGAVVLDIGLATTPLVNFALCNYHHSGAVMVTASHNPPAYNGFKLMKEEGIQLYGEKIQEIKKIAQKESFKEAEGTIKKKDPLPAYTSHLLSSVDIIDEDLKVVVDYGNGIGSITGKEVLTNLPIETINLFDEVDGAFPNHLPDPQPDNMQKLIQTVKEKEADIGIFFDGDADRAFFVDEKGEIVYPDLLIAFLIKKELRQAEEKKVYFDLRFSKITAQETKKAGGKPIMMRVGNPFYKERLTKEEGLLGAELSGHIMHKDHFYIDDGLFVVLQVLERLSSKEKSFSELIAPLKKYHQSEEINMEVDNKKQVLQKVKEEYSHGRYYDIDGVYIEFEDWWFNVRQSNTEDLVRLRIEADTKQLLEEKKEALISLIK